MLVSTLRTPKIEVCRSNTEDDKFNVLFEDDDNQVIVRLSDFQGQVLVALVNETVYPIKKKIIDQSRMRHIPGNYYQVVVAGFLSPGNDPNLPNFIFRGKIEVIKQVREITGLGLKEAKDLVEISVDEPQVICEFKSRVFAEAVYNAIENTTAKHYFDIREVEK